MARTSLADRKLLVASFFQRKASVERRTPNDSATDFKFNFFFSCLRSKISLGARVELTVLDMGGCNVEGCV
jgi:hypothetical protein